MFKIFFVLFLLYRTGSGFLNLYGRPTQIPINGDVGDPLFLTPLIKAGKLEEARTAAAVSPFAGNVKSYSGYLTVNKKYNSNLFFWFFEANHNSANAPVVLWLQGGPGSTSLFGLFAENGPYIVTNNMSVILRQYSWTVTSNVLFIDNPVGTGYSFTEHEDGYARNQTDVATNLYIALIQFFTLFPNLQKNNFFITGESYAGKYVPAISYMIYKMNPKASFKINLQGLAIGNGLCDPKHMLLYSDYLYQLGILDKNGKEIFSSKELEALACIKQKKWLEAFEIFDALLNGDRTTSLFTNLTGLTNYYNYLDLGLNPIAPINEFVQLASVRKSIHVGNLTFNDGIKVEDYLKEDIMKSVVDWIEVLIEKYKLLIYNGQLDIIVAYPLTLGFLNNLNWSGSKLYRNAPRKIWKVNNVIAGFSKTVKRFTEVLVRDAGHMVPADQPLFAFDLINRFIFNKTF